MRAPELLAELAATGIAVALAGDDLEVMGDWSAHSASLLERLRTAKPALLDYLRSPEGSHPEFAAAIQLGTLVFCLRCRHYQGPPRKALGYCRALRTESAPDVPFDCPSFTSLAAPDPWGLDTEVFP